MEPPPLVMWLDAAGKGRPARALWTMSGEQKRADMHSHAPSSDSTGCSGSIPQRASPRDIQRGVHRTASVALPPSPTQIH